MFLTYFRRSMATEVLARASLRCSSSSFLHAIAARASPLHQLVSFCFIIFAITQPLSSGSVFDCIFSAGCPVGRLFCTGHTMRARNLMCHGLLRLSFLFFSPLPGSAPPALCSLCSFCAALYKLLGLAGEAAPSEKSSLGICRRGFLPVRASFNTVHARTVLLSGLPPRPYCFTLFCRT